ncbi:tyrosine-type recombinase/integrase [Flammeovirga kamogawensis]|uniref:Site-specific integrase n=1 Tax=Flammeovirga kamogawensis TaxID=373891 RepID=A0ABX8GYK8_9BACT|nr:site-specific integrase [Flammeovirga kamogawensis]MBB6460660.1 integrase [Flammeovirga kamogawensis]QWG08015.1 site-specific integrase [Flammeovirga kamogawensis]TRX69822.1 tyrosine-type recombinase/integrase [Flammeovirga kamogawensis]
MKYQLNSLKSVPTKEIKEGMYLDSIIKEYKSYLLSDINDEKINTAYKALTVFKNFLDYLLRFREGRFSKISFDKYSEYLSDLVEKEELSTSQKAFKRMYGRRIAIEGKAGYLRWMSENNINQVLLKPENTLLSNKWDDNFKLWLASKSKLRRSTSYPIYISNIVNNYINWIYKDSDLQIINDISVNQFLRNKAHLKTSTLNLYLKAIKRFADFFIEKSEDSKGIFEAKKILSLNEFETNNTIERIRIDSETLNKLYKNANEKIDLILHLGVDLGLRASSMINLKIEDIDWRRKKIAIWVKGKNEKEVLPIPKELFDALEKYCFGMMNDEYILGFNTKNSSSISKYFSDFLLRNDAKIIEKEEELYSISLHNLRHTFAYNSLDKYGLIMTSKLLCHSSVEITQKHYLKDKLRDEMNNIFIDQYK